MSTSNELTLSNYISSRFDVWFNGEIEDKWDKAVEQYKDVAEDFVGTLETLQIVKKSHYDKGYGPRFDELVKDVEKEMGMSFDDIGELIQDNRGLETAGPIFKVLVPYMWRRRKEFYYMLMALKILAITMLLSSATCVFNPLVWFRFWIGYYEYR